MYCFNCLEIPTDTSCAWSVLEQLFCIKFSCCYAIHILYWEPWRLFPDVIELYVWNARQGHAAWRGQVELVKHLYSAVQKARSINPKLNGLNWNFQIISNDMMIGWLKLDGLRDSSNENISLWYINLTLMHNVNYEQGPDKDKVVRRYGVVVGGAGTKWGAFNIL